MEGLHLCLHIKCSFKEGKLPSLIKESSSLSTVQIFTNSASSMLRLVHIINYKGTTLSAQSTKLSSLIVCMYVHLGHNYREHTASRSHHLTDPVRSPEFYLHGNISRVTLQSGSKSQKNVFIYVADLLLIMASFLSHTVKP
jgi:hypothetical protein